MEIKGIQSDFSVGSQESLQHTFQAGDTLGGVASQFGVSVESLVAQNPEINKALLGQTLAIPQAQLERSPAVEAFSQDVMEVAESSNFFSQVGGALEDKQFEANFQQDAGEAFAQKPHQSAFGDAFAYKPRQSAFGDAFAYKPRQSTFGDALAQKLQPGDALTDKAFGGEVLSENVISKDAVAFKMVDASLNFDQSDLPLPQLSQKFVEIGDQFKTLFSEFEEKLGNIGDEAQLANVDLQNTLQKQQQVLQTMANVSKLLHDTALAVIRKIG